MDFKKDTTTKRAEELPSGIWLSLWFLRIIYTPSIMKQLKENINNIDAYDPRSIMLFMSPQLGRQKSQETNLSISENLIEIPIIIEGEDDGYFDENDRIIFYGRGQSGFDINGEM